MQPSAFQAPLLTTEEAAQYLTVSRRTLERWRTEGGGPAYVKLGGCIRYRVSDLDEYIASELRTATCQQGAG